MKQPATRELYNLWNELRGDRAAPDRAEIEPAAIPALLNDTFMLAIDGPAGFPIRLAGARITELFMADVKDAPFLNLFQSDDQDSVRALLESVIDDPTPVVAGVKAAPLARDPLDLELLFLPLGPLHTGQARVFGALTPAYRVAWHGLLPVLPMRLTSLRILRETQVQPFGRMSFDPSLWSTHPLTNVSKVAKLPLRHPNLTLYDR